MIKRPIFNYYIDENGILYNRLGKRVKLCKQKKSATCVYHLHTIDLDGNKKQLVIPQKRLTYMAFHPNEDLTGKIVLSSKENSTHINYLFAVQKDLGIAKMHKNDKDYQKAYRNKLLSYKTKCNMICEIVHDDSMSDSDKIERIDTLLKNEFEKLTKSERNNIYYSTHRQKEIDRVREWEKKNPEKRREYTRRYYQSPAGKQKKREQRIRYKLKKEGKQ